MLARSRQRLCNDTALRHSKWREIAVSTIFSCIRILMRPDYYPRRKQMNDMLSFDNTA